MTPRVALTTYSVKPRGGVVHTLELAEALTELGISTTVIAMGDPEAGFFRPVRADYHIIPAPGWAETLEDRVFSWIDAMTRGLDELAGDFDIVHSQDCISARAVHRVRTRADAKFVTLRTVHHVDDFTTQALIDCQEAAIREPDHVLVVSELWRKQLSRDYGVEATVVSNGVRTDRFDASRTDQTSRTELRSRAGALDRHLFLTVGGIEPRKGSKYLIEALGILKADMAPGTSPVLAIIGGHSFQDYNAYSEEVLGSLPDCGLTLRDDVVLLGTVPDSELPRWFHAADSFVFPSLNEGWGLVILEALAAGLPVVASDIEVFQEFLEPDVNAVLTRAGDAASLAGGMKRVMTDSRLSAQLSAGGPGLAGRYTWTGCAAQHVEIYRAMGFCDSRGAPAARV